MEWSEVIKENIDTLKPVKASPELIQRLMSLVDYTSLNDTDTTASIASFLEKAQNDYGHVAAVCVRPEFVRMAAAQFAGTPVKVATVANFPEGNDSLEVVLTQISQALQDGAQEIDVVLPYHRYLAGEHEYVHMFVTSCKAACGEKVLLKVILETGILNDPVIIAGASLEALSAGADFIKTSTGKIAQGATLEAATTMLLVIRDLSTKLNKPIGIKISGGVRDMQQAAQYVELADTIMGRGWVTPQTFRIGASKLVDEMLQWK